jgi:uncharacterized protein involved in exopolysaccharide biosynthesis
MAPPSSYGSSEGGHSRSSESSGFSRYYEIVREHWLLIVICTVIAVAAAAVYVTVAPKSYTATAQLLANPAQAGDTELFSLPVLHSSGDPTQDILTAADLVTTPQVANAVIAKLGLHQPLCSTTSPRRRSERATSSASRPRRRARRRRRRSRTLSRTR